MLVLIAVGRPQGFLFDTLQFCLSTEVGGNTSVVPLKGERLICKSLIRKGCLSKTKTGRKILGSSAMQQGLLSIQVP